MKIHGDINIREIMKEQELGRIIVDAQGTEKPIYKDKWPSFPDKKRSKVNPAEIEIAVNQVRKIKEEAHVGQERAIWLPKLDYPDRAMLFLFLTDPHYASIRTDHNLMNYYIDVVKNTPNMFLVTGGDDIDNFNISLGKTSSGVYEDPIEPGIQGRAWAKKMKDLDHKDKIGFMVFGNHCFDEQTECLTNEGWKNYKELEIGTRIATYNRDIKQIEYLPIEKMYIDNYIGDMVSFKGQTLDLLVTPNHRMITKRYKDFIYANKVDINNNGILAVPEVIPNEGIYHPTEDKIKLVAWIVTEGNLEKAKNPRITIAQSDKNSEYCSEIASLLKRMKLERKARKIKSQATGIKNVNIWRFYFKKVQHLFDGENIHQIPKWIFQLPPDLKEVFIRTLYKGDGTKATNEYTTIRKELAEQLQLLFFQIGIRATYKYREDIGCYIVKPRGFFSKRYNTAYSQCRKKEIVFYNGMVWCPSTKNQTVVVKRNGCIAITGNTDWTYHQGQDWYDTYLGDMNCPLLTSGGRVTVQFEKGARYEIAATHRYWGTSKLNPTNACKRYLEHEHPSADIILLGHTHQSEILEFDRGGKQRIGVVGGSLKLFEDYAKKHGIGGRAGTPGMCIALWPDQQEMQGYKRFDRAVEEHIARLKR